MQNFDGTSWGHNDDRVSFSNGFALLDGPIWGVDCSKKYSFKSTEAGVRIIIDPNIRKNFDLVSHDNGNRLIFEQNSQPIFFERIK